MPIARLSRDKLRRLSDDRLQEADVLLRAGLWTGAYYLTGLAIECALKSCLAGAVREHDFPDRDFVNKMYVHKLTTLFELNGALWAQFQVDMKADAKLNLNWSVVKDWDDSKRYDLVDELSAKDLYNATIEPESGVIEWVRGKW
jgi:hypothetical protein